MLVHAVEVQLLSGRMAVLKVRSPLEGFILRREGGIVFMYL